MMSITTESRAGIKHGAGSNLMLYIFIYGSMAVFYNNVCMILHMNTGHMSSRTHVMFSITGQ